MTRKSWPDSEVDLARPVVEWLRSEGWTVYQEVDVGSRFADIVAVSDGKVWIIECKTSLGLPVLAQARYWLQYSNLTSVAVPRPRSYPSEAYALATYLAVHLGIGILQVREPIAHIPQVSVREHPLSRCCSLDIMGSLREKQQDHCPAGSQTGTRYTAFQESCDQVRALLLERGPTTIRDAVQQLGKLHYASKESAMSSLYVAASTGTVKGVACEGRNRSAMLRLEDGS